MCDPGLGRLVGQAPGAHLPNGSSQGALLRVAGETGCFFSAPPRGPPKEPHTVDTRHFKPLLRRAGLPDIRWHDLRHSCFTLLLSRGVHPKFVQHLAGHASIQLTLDRYSHWMPTMGKHTASAMDEALDEADREDAPEDEKGALER